MDDTRGPDYTARLQRRGGAGWKQVLDVQAPYRRRLRRYRLGRTLDVGCGIGRHLANLVPGSVGVDHNATSVAAAVAAGLEAVTTEEWPTSGYATPSSFDALLVAHVVEHLDRSGARALLSAYLPSVRSGGKVLLICPQERGYASDPTHVTWTTPDDLVALATNAGLHVLDVASFPFPRFVGRFFTHNETHLLAGVP